MRNGNMDIIQQFLNEKIGFAFSGNHVTYDWQQFVDRKKGLIIVGLSGSGKSTLGSALSKKMKCPYIEEDEIPHADDKWYDVKNILKALSKDKVFVYEGIQITDLCTKDNDEHKIIVDVNKYAFLIVNSSLTLATYRAYKRNGKLGRPMLKRFKYNKGLRKHLNAFEKLLDKTKLVKSSISSDNL